MKALVGRSTFAGARPADSRRWLMETIARFRPRWRPLFDKHVIAAVCECPSLTYELLVAAREGVAPERVEIDDIG
jgi:hypothetical protein